jgi:DNA-binding transcriptional regulator YiaG
VPNVMGVLRAEIRRLARKETRQEIATLRKHVNSMRRRVAESRRRIRDLESRAKQAGKRMPGAIVASDADGGKQVRFSPAWVKRHRSKLGMSRRIYAKLLSVSPQTIMGWESGRTRPRRSALQTWRDLRGKGVRELRASVAGGGTKRRRGAAKKRARRKLRVRGRRVARHATTRRTRAKKK